MEYLPRPFHNSFRDIQRPFAAADEWPAPMSFSEAADAADRVRLPLAMESPDGLSLFALYRQSLIGDIPADDDLTSKNMALLERAQREAWRRIRGMPSSVAQRKYATLVQDLMQFDDVVDKVADELLTDLSDKDLLEFHALQRQSTHGDCWETHPPKGTTLFERKQWSEWAKLKGATQREARRLYHKKYTDLTNPSGASRPDLGEFEKVEERGGASKHMHEHVHHHYHHYTPGM